MYKRAQFDELAARLAEPRRMDFVVVSNGKSVAIEEFLQWNLGELLND